MIEEADPFKPLTVRVWLIASANPSGLGWDTVGAPTPTEFAGFSWASGLNEIPGVWVWAVTTAEVVEDFLPFGISLPFKEGTNH